MKSRYVGLVLHWVAMEGPVGPMKTRRREGMLGPFTAVAEPSDLTVNCGSSQPGEICPYSSALNPEAAWPLASLVHH